MSEIFVTHYHPKPIPLRLFDWCATTDNYEAGAPIGYGSTEVDAVRDLEIEIEGRQ